MKQFNFLFVFSFILLAVCGLQSGEAQTLLPVEVKILYQGHAVALDESAYNCGTPDSLVITQVKFYLGHFTFNYKGHSCGKADSSYYLVDAGNKQSLHFNCRLEVPAQADEIYFALGIDSATSQGGALAGDLDPSKGMYWTWHSGYINCKIEGNSKLVPGEKHSFEFHLGGYQHAFSNWQQLHFPIRNPKKIVLEMELCNFFSGIDLRQDHHLLSPSKKAVEVSRLLAKTISVK